MTKFKHMEVNRFLLFKVFGILFLIQNCFAQINIIPQPNQITPTLGHFYLTKNTKIIAEKELSAEKSLLKEVLSPASGFSFDTKKSDKVIRLKISKKETNANPESYELEVLENKITISRPSKIGIVWGIQSLRLLLGSDIFREAKIDKNWQIPCLKISDSPKHGYRGFMLDCSRTFISKNEIKKYIKVMSLFKMNTLHLHLTDDQGWRIEIKKYPQLAEKASKYAPEITEPAEYQGYYSQDDLKELVAYAAKWNIEIIPEIEMPGHSLAVFAAFPDLSCKGDTAKVKPWAKNVGLTKQIYCAGNDQTFTFIEQVLTETMSIFPSEYIHIGGDEAPKEYWKECPKKNVKKE